MAMPMQGRTVTRISLMSNSDDTASTKDSANVASACRLLVPFNKQIRRHPADAPQRYRQHHPHFPVVVSDAAGESAAASAV